MKNITVMAALLGIALSPVNMAAQENADADNAVLVDPGGPSRCFYSSKSFALGSPILIGEKIYVCTMEDNSPRWAENDKIKTANCLFASNYYAPGSIMRSGADNTSVVCLGNGTWKRIAQ